MSPRFLADENIDPALVLGLKRRVGSIDIVGIQEAGLRTLDDPTVLAGAADAGRALVSKDVKTVPTFAHERIIAGLAMPGVFVLPSTVSMAAAIDDLALIADATNAGEWAERVVYLPLR